MNVTYRALNDGHSWSPRSPSVPCLHWYYLSSFREPHSSPFHYPSHFRMAIQSITLYFLLAPRSRTPTGRWTPFQTRPPPSRGGFSPTLCTLWFTAPRRDVVSPLTILRWPRTISPCPLDRNPSCHGCHPREIQAHNFQLRAAIASHCKHTFPFWVSHGFYDDASADSLRFVARVALATLQQRHLRRL